VLFDSRASDLAADDWNDDDDVFVRDMQAGVTMLVSANCYDGEPADGWSGEPVMSADRRYVAFQSSATDLTEGDLEAENNVFVRDLLLGTNRLCSARFGTADGANDDSEGAWISADGQVVVFESYGSDLSPLDVNEADEDIFAWRMSTGVAMPVSVARSATPARGADRPMMSADGRFVAFESESANLLAGDMNGSWDVFVYDLDAGTNLLASVNGAGTDAGNESSGSPSISSDGRYVAFESAASDLVPNDVSGWTSDVFVRDLQTAETRLVSVNRGGFLPGNGDSGDPVLSANGQVVVFVSQATDLTAHLDLLREDEEDDVFAHELVAGTTTLISVNRFGTATGNGPSWNPVLSADGRYIAFRSHASDLVANDANNQDDIFVYDRVNGSNTLVSVNAAGTGSGNSGSYDLRISADGRYIAFLSNASDLVANDANERGDVFLRDLVARVTHLVSVNRFGTGGGNGNSDTPSLSADGRYVAFASFASDLVVNDLNERRDVFVRDLVANTTTLVSVNCAGTGGGNSSSSAPRLSADGRWLAFVSQASDLVAGSFPAGYDQVYRRDLLLGETVLLTANQSHSGGGNKSASPWQISANGNAVLIRSAATDLVARDLNDADDVFVWRAGSVLPGVDLALNKTALSSRVAQGQETVFTLTATNQGGSSATGVVITDTLPAGLNFVSAQTSQGSYTSAGNLITFNLGNLAAASVATMTLRATASGSGSVVNTAVATASEPDVAPANNQAAATVEITGASLTLLSPGWAGTDFTFSFQSQSGQSYTVEYNDDLRTTNWLFHHSLLGDGSLLPCLVPMTNGTHRFFRVRMP
jgi:uncharacterized repeat protein (TIGR01451 family)